MDYDGTRMRRRWMVIGVAGLICIAVLVGVLWLWQRRRTRVNELLWREVKSGDAAAVSWALSLGADPDAEFSGQSVLQWSIEWDRTGFLPLLLVQGPEIDAVSSGYGRTALQTAALCGRTDAVKLLLTAGADAGLRSRDGHTTLWYGLLGANPAAIDALMSAGSRLEGQDPLANAVLRGDVAAVRDGLANAPDEPGKLEGGFTLLHLAAATGRAEIAELLLNPGYAAGRRADDGAAPLSLAARGGHADVADLLLRNGAFPDPIDWRGYTPLHSAVVARSPEAAGLLIAARANVEAKGHVGYTALHLAAGGHPDLVEVLLAAGADPNAEDRSKRTPLHAAVAAQDPVSVRLLTDAGATNRAALRGVTPLDVAIFGTSGTATLEALAPSPADIAARDMSGQTALHCAAALGHRQQVEWLLEHGADPHVRDLESRTPADLARHNGYADVPRLLEDAEEDSISSRQ